VKEDNSSGNGGTGGSSDDNSNGDARGSMRAVQDGGQGDRRRWEGGGSDLV
jgi:hypothetical protein